MVRTIGIAALALLVGCAGDGPAGSGEVDAHADTRADAGGAAGAGGTDAVTGASTWAGGSGGGAGTGAGGHAGAGGAAGTGGVGSGGTGGATHYEVCPQPHVYESASCLHALPDGSFVETKKAGMVCLWCDATDAGGKKIASPEECISPGPTQGLCVNPSCAGCF